MPPKLKAKQKYFIVIFLVLFFFVGQPREFGLEKAFFHGFPIELPVIKIGLEVNLSDARVLSSAGMKIYQVGTDYKLLADGISEVRVRGHKEKLTEKYVILAGQARSRQEAESLADQVEAKIRTKAYITEDTLNKNSGVFQVRVGDFQTRGDALNLIKRLNQAGIENTWILQEEVTEEHSKPLWILVDEKLIDLTPDTVLYIIPSSPESYLAYNGRNYRGIFVIEPNRKGVVLVNILNLDQYLKGVVPSELSPYQYGEIEALKAQAVAARTYALRNLGQNSDLGFDLVSTPDSQFYGGMSAEHDLSNQAVEETSGDVALYDGKLINALYTSTCGGMTEDVENVFEGQSQPYLRSTECASENQKEWQFKTSSLLPAIYVGAKNVSSLIGQLITLKVIPAEADPLRFKQVASLEETVSWIKNALSLVGKKNEKLAAEGSRLDLPSFARLIIGAFGWQDRVKNLLLGSEASHITRDFPQLKGQERDHLAYLMLAGIFPTTGQIGTLERPLSRAEVALYLHKTISAYADFCHQGVFQGFDKDKLEISEGAEKRQMALAAEAFLVRNWDGDSSFASSIYLEGGESVKWIEKDGVISFLEVAVIPDSNVLDRISLYHRWQVRRSREELEARVNLYYPVGQLIDIIPQKRGNSRRVAELSLVGTESQVRVTGLKIRWVLGLRETLFVVDREYGEDGRIAYFHFSGRGWGHGVGLCQVGAFRMAQSGADYKEILKKYYQGIKVSKIY
jgi:stage II sporulation protein D